LLVLPLQGFAARVRTAADAADVMRVLRSDRKIARATHNMMAYRCLSAGGAGAGVVADNDEDGEDGAGSRLAQLLSSAGVADAIVVVSRWYGGIKLGPDRFKHIGNIAREALVLGGFVVDGAGKRARR
jgi:putative IMPACT (imprinted ancient) family translation regulator